jgi:hypothetical protein
MHWLPLLRQFVYTSSLQINIMLLKIRCSILLQLRAFFNVFCIYSLAYYAAIILGKAEGKAA